MALSVRPQFNMWDREGQARSTLEAQFGFGQAVAENSVAGFLSSFGIGTLVREGITPQPVREYDPNAPLWTIPNPFSDAAKTAGAIGAVIRGDKPEPAITEEEFAASPDWRKQIPYETGMTKSRLAALAAQYDVAEARAMMSQKEWGGAFIGQFLGQMLDPINYVPFTGPAVQTAAVARAGGILGRIGVAATDAAISTAVFGAATAEWRRKFGDDISFEAMAQEIGMSMVIGGVFGAGLGVLSIPADRRMRDAAIIDAAATRMNSLRDVQGRQAILSDSTSRLAAGLEMNPAARVEFERQAAKFQDEIRIQEERDIGRAVEARTVAQRAEIAAAKVELEAIPAETPRAVELSKRVMELEDYVQRVDTVYRAQRELVARGVAFEPDVAARAAEAPPVADGTTRLYTATDPAAGQPVAASVEAPAKGDGWYMDVPTEQAAELTARPIEPPAKAGEAQPGVQPMAWQQLPKIEAPPVSPFRRLMINRFMEGGRSGEEGLALAKTFEAAYANLSARAGWTPEKMLQEYPLPEVVYRGPERAPEPKAEEGVPVFDDGKPHFYDGPAENAPDGKPLASETEMLFAPPTSVADVPTVARSEGTLASGIEALDPETVTVDAKRFQFKEGGDEFGVTDRLQGVETWDERLAGTSLVFRDADGKNWVADGHQRFGLAKRLMASGHPPIKVNAFVLDATNGYTDASARAIAAVKNIAEGTGTAVDAAKVLRAAKDSGIDLPPLPPRSALVRDGRALAELSPDAFGMVVNEVVPAAYGAIIGRMVKNPLQQTEAVRIIATLKPDNARQVELVVRDMLASGTEQLTRQGGLFGAEDFAQSIVLERAKIADEALKQIRQDKRTFGTLVSEAERIELQGNTLSRSANEARLSTDEKAAELLTQLAFRAGPVSDTLSEVARKLKLGQLTASAAAREFLGTVRSAVESGLDTGADVGSAGSRAADDGVTPRDPDTIEMFQSARWRLGDKLGMFDTEPGLEGLPQALIPGVAPIDETARMRAAAAKPLRGGDAPMKEGSLFDTDTSKQLTLFQSAPPTDTPAFRAWFGSSKVVDADGEPLVVYHGTNQPIAQFDIKRGGASTGENAGATKAFFFTSQRVEADQYARAAGRRVPANVEAFERERAKLQRDVARYEKAGNWDAYEAAMQKWEDLEARAAQEDEMAGYNVIEAYLSVENPMEVDFGGNRINDTFDLDVLIDKAKAAGNDGLILRNIEDSPEMGIVSDHYVVFESTQIKSIANRGTFDPNDPRILYQVSDDATLWEPDTGRNMDETPRGQIKFKDGKSLMTLFDGADPSTALHEAGHHFLMMIKDMGERTDTGPGIKEDWAQVKGWLAVNAKDVATEAGNDVTPDDVLAVLNRNTSGDKMKDIAINRGIHEQWARGFEAYHLEGKAPSAGMRGVFESFRKWLAAIYASVKSLNVNLTPEIRQVFDRLLTDEPTVERAVVTAPERPAGALTLDPPEPELPDAPLVEAGARAGKSEDVAGFEEQIGAKVDGSYNEEGDIDMLRSLGRVLPEEEAALKQADDGYKDAVAYEKAIKVALACVMP